MCRSFAFPHLLDVFLQRLDQSLVAQLLLCALVELILQVDDGALVAVQRLFQDFDFAVFNLFSAAEFAFGMHGAAVNPGEDIHFMGVSVAHSDGEDTELDADGCYARNCLTEYEGGDGIASAQVRIPIKTRFEAAMLEAMKSGQSITFRYQTEKSYADNSFMRMTLGLKGSRQAIEMVEAVAMPDHSDAGQAPAASDVATKTAAAGSGTAGTEVAASGDGVTFFQDDTQDGDEFCPARELADFPEHISDVLRHVLIDWDGGDEGR